MLGDEHTLIAIPGTSKYCSEVACHGHNGTFLASLGALSLLTIASRHHEYRSDNLLTLHQAKAIRREIPAASQHDMHSKHGTRVTVRNLFGNFPVRVKQRGMATVQKEYDRLWEALKREITNLMLSWREPVSVKIRDGDGRTIISLSTMASVGCETGTRLSALKNVLNLLTQASLICHDDWESWVPVSASTPTISIRGAISLNPAPSRRVQFISLGICPLSIDSGHNELFDEINRIFASSSFGTVETDADAENEEFERTQGYRAKQPKKDGHSNRQLTARKGVDRYPMFHLCLSLRHGDKKDVDRAEYLFDQDRVTLGSVVETLKALVNEWLDVHHFRSPGSCLRQLIASSHTTDASETSAPLGRPDSGFHQMSDSRVATISPITKSGNVNVRKRKKSKASLLDQNPGRNPRLAFSDWSRTKSGSASFLNNVGKKENFHLLTRSSKCIPSSTSIDSALQIPLETKLEVPPVFLGSLDAGVQSDHSAKEDYSVKEDSPDGAIPWTDPTTRHTVFLNARTGCVVPSSLDVPLTHPSSFNEGNRRRIPQKPARLPLKTTPYSDNSDNWLNDVLGGWKNPVFKPTETSIQRISLQEDRIEHACDRSRYFGLKSNQNFRDSPAFPAFPASNTSKLSKAGLRHAEVIAQVDRKFILVKIRQSGEILSGSKDGDDLLVLVDQHAADERIRVETLLAEMCALVPDEIGSYRSKLGHHSPVVFTMLDKPIQFHLSSEEQEQFTAHAAEFAAWGILFDITTRTVPLSRPQYILSVTTLPPAVSERCKADPQVLVAFLRTAVWKYATDPVLPPVPSGTKADAAEWVRCISSCPEGLVDLVSSRACRSAIMFNDRLNVEECRELIRKLCECVFPFMCAHGRPSMVPLVGVDAIEAHAVMNHPERVYNNSVEQDESFIGAWKRWQRQ